jgi:hypothetical protein
MKIKLEFKCYQNIYCSDDKIYAFEVTEELFPAVLQLLQDKCYIVIREKTPCGSECLIFKRGRSAGRIYPHDYLSLCVRCACGDARVYRHKSFFADWRLLDDKPMFVTVDVFPPEKDDIED